MNKVSILKPFMRDVVFAGNSDSFEKIYTIMVEHDISMVPILERQRKNMFVVRRKTILEKWMKSGSRPDLSLIKESPLPEVSMNESLDVALQKLHSSSAVLVRNDTGLITHFISPRVIANALEDYSVKFRVLERIESLIRTILERVSTTELKLALIRKGEQDNDNIKEPDLSKLTFSDYVTAFSVLWEKLGLSSLDKKTVVNLIEEVRKFRNSVMHFHLVYGTDELQSAIKLERLLKD